MEDEENSKLIEWMQGKLDEMEKEIAALKAMLKLFQTQGGVQHSQSPQQVPSAEIPVTQPRSIQAQAMEGRSTQKQPTAERPSEVVPAASEEEVPIRQIIVRGNKVAAVFRKGSEVRVDVLVPLEQDTPPFKSFFVEKILKDFERKDRMKEESGQISKGTGLSYEVQLEGNEIKRITVRNVNDEERIREIVSTLNWTINRMMERSGV
ncbi:MAG: hypothetical protein ACP5UI_03355 [Thermoprotei archaeon]|nr:hypothetical protein [TACK group archaeon]